MAEVDGDRPEVSLLFAVGCSTYLTLSKIGCDHESRVRLEIRNFISKIKFDNKVRNQNLKTTYTSFAE
jgi:hypothetical protein